MSIVQTVIQQTGIYDSVLDGRGITPREIATLEFIIASNDYVLTDDAVELLQRKIDAAQS